jgi:hypothetical protein
MIGLFSQGKFPKALLYAHGTRPYRDAWPEITRVGSFGEENPVDNGSNIRFNQTYE